MHATSYVVCCLFLFCPNTFALAFSFFTFSACAVQNLSHVCLAAEHKECSKSKQKIPASFLRLSLTKESKYIPLIFILIACSNDHILCIWGDIFLISPVSLFNMMVRKLKITHVTCILFLLDIAALCPLRRVPEGFSHRSAHGIGIVLL